jgi:diaminopimelate epimerase
MELKFTKMQGAGNDFVVIDATAAPLSLSTAQMQRLGDRRFGVGADQILVVEQATRPDVDFRYRIFNGASGAEVEHCGNGARCFVRYVRDHGLSDKNLVRVETVNNLLELRLQDDGRVTVNMSQPRFAPADLPFNPKGLRPRAVQGYEVWPLALQNGTTPGPTLDVAIVSMGNPHAVMRVDNLNQTPVAELGPLVESHTRFARKVNAGFMQVISRSAIALRVYERDAGETLACGTGACAAVVVGIRLGWLGPRVDVQTHGGLLTVEWAGLGHDVFLTGPAVTVFEGEISL